MNDSGSFVIAWVGQDGSGTGVFARRYDSNGNAQGTEFRVNTTTSNDQLNPTVTIDSNGRFVVVWQDSGQDGNGWGIYAQRYNADGTKSGSETRINTYTSGDQVRPAAALDNSGNYVITWSSNDQDGNGWGVYANCFNKDGVQLGSEFRVNQVTSDYQDYSSVARGPAGDFVITWSSKNQDGDGYGVYARRYDTDRVAQGNEFRVNSTTSNDQMYSSVAMDNDANFFITWASLTQDGSGWGVFAQQYRASGALQGEEFRINTVTSGDQKNASVAIASTGHAMVVWSGNGASDSDGVFAKLFRINAGNGLSNLEAGQPHGYGPDGCGCADHADHAHAEEDTGCGCATCSTAVAVVQTGASGTDLRVHPVRAANLDDLRSLVARLGGDRMSFSLPAVATRHDSPVRFAQDVVPNGHEAHESSQTLRLPTATHSEDNGFAEDLFGESFVTVPGLHFGVAWVSLA
jgi:hypothetical protein